MAYSNSHVGVERTLTMSPAAQTNVRTSFCSRSLPPASRTVTQGTTKRSCAKAMALGQ